ncbi:MAG: TonB-dependent receptor [Acidobacteriaceae bacterium]|nr:TonB-dependent receptor [Acidobacteriaceae bacterium]
MKTSFERSFFCLVLGFALAASAMAQSTTGTLIGTVTDSSGAAVAGAKVRVTNLGNGATLETSSGATGEYAIPNLPAATYKIRVENTGFRSVDINEVRLLLNQTVRNDVRLEPGAVEQSVTVTSSVPTIQTDSASIANNIDTHSVVTLPLNGRTLDRLILITAGNTSDSPSNPKLAGSLHWGGSFYSIDGVAINDTGNGGASYSFRTQLSTTPSIDTIQEFKIETNSAKAEHEGSAAISIITKGGTNDLHGSLFAFNRNREFSANQYFNNANRQQRPPFNRNEFGVTAGGPVIRNKTFFFGSYEGLRQRQATTSFFAYATPAMRAGNFAGVRDIRDPLSNLPFPNNQIPTNRIDSRASRWGAFMPQPNTPGTTAAGTGLNHVANVGNVIDVNRSTARADHNFNEQNRINVVMAYSKGSPYFVSNGGPNAYGNFSDGGYITKNASLTYNRTIGATKQNEFRYAYFSHGSIRVGQNTTFDPTSLFPTLYGPLPIGGLPTATFNGVYGQINDSGGSERAPQITQQITDNFSFTRGRHTFKTGVDIGFSRIASNPAAGAAQFGSFSFNGRYSNDPYADFLLGYPITATRGTPSLVNLLYYSRYGAYFQDDWQVNSKLTINVGMRYMLQTQTQERDGSFANFDLEKGAFVVRSEGGKLAPLSLPRLLQAYPHVGSEQNGWGSNVITADHNNFGPRLGFAYRPFNDSKTVLRGGFGVYYNVIPVYIGIRQISNANAPFQLTETFESGATAPTLTLATPFPGLGAISANPNLTAINRNIRNTQSTQWNLTVERDLGAQFGLRVTYLGNKGTRVPWYNYERNLPLTQAPGTIQSRRPFQPFASIATLDTNGNSITHQGQLEVTRRFSGGFYFQSNYTWTSTLDNVPIVGGPQNPYYAAADRANGDSIRKHVAYTSLTYDLPFGPGKKFANVGGVAGKVIGGWTVASILQFRSGTPFSVAFSPNQAGWYASRVNVVSSNVYPATQDIEGYINPSAFAIPAPFTFGDSARNMLFGPGQKIIDLSLLKTTPITERIRAEFRAEAFNMPNTPSFGNPASNLTAIANFGKIRGTTVEARVVQFGLKLLF